MPMRARVAVPSLLCALLLILPAAARADYPHVVAPGESLYSIAATDGLSVAALAAANGLPLDAQLIAGSTILIPPQGITPAGPAVATGSTVSTAAGSVAGDGDADSDDTGAGAAVPAVATTSASGGAYVVQPGDTLTAVAARAGTSVAALAAANGLDPNGILPAGAVLRVSGLPAAGVALPVTTSTQPVGAAAEGSASAPPYPTPERLSAGTVGQIAADNGVPASLGDAIAWQESGFNNDVVSSSDARGIMQILPGTWAWIQHSLVAGAPPLAPASAYDNVRGGALLLHWLLQSTGGNQAMAAAGYFQGLPSVERYGMFQSTQQYVNDVMALQQQFGGG